MDALTCDDFRVEHEWQLISMPGRYGQQRCTTCGLTLARIGLVSPVSQPSCRPAPSGADRSTTP